MIKLKVTNHIRQDRLQDIVQEDKNIMVINSIKSFVQYLIMYSYFRYLVKNIIGHLLTAHALVYQQISYQQYIENISETKVVQ